MRELLEAMDIYRVGEKKGGRWDLPVSESGRAVTCYVTCERVDKDLSYKWRATTTATI